MVGVLVDYTRLPALYNDKLYIMDIFLHKFTKSDSS